MSKINHSPSMSFEEQLGVFSPDGRLIQVEYAQQASEQGTLVVFAVDSEKVSVSIEHRTSNKMLVESEKLVLICESQGIWMSYSGLKPDAYSIVNVARLICRSYKINVGEDIMIDQLARQLSEYKQQYTVVHHQRPFGVRTAIFGVIPEPVIYIIEPDGNFSEFYSGAIGQKSQKVCEYLETAPRSDLVSFTVFGITEAVQYGPGRIFSSLITRDGCKKIDEAVIFSIVNQRIC